MYSSPAASSPNEEMLRIGLTMPGLSSAVRSRKSEIAVPLKEKRLRLG